MAVITNYFANPSIETNTTGWLADAGSALSRITSGAWIGTSALEVVQDGVAGDRGVISWTIAAIPTVPGEQWTMSNYAKSSDIANVYTALLEYDAASGFLRLGVGASYPLTGSYSRIKVTKTMGASTAYVIYAVRTLVADAGTMVLDGFMATKTSDAIDYFDGDTVDTGTYSYDWLGTPHASASTRTENLGIPPKLNKMNVRTNALLRR